MLLQANFVDAEKEWKEEKHRLEVRHHDMVEKHEHELSEKELLVENLRYSLVKYETAYAEATSQYSALQVRYYNRWLTVGSFVLKNILRNNVN